MGEVPRKVPDKRGGAVLRLLRCVSGPTRSVWTLNLSSVTSRHVLNSLGVQGYLTRKRCTPPPGTTVGP